MKKIGFALISLFLIVLSFASTEWREETRAADARTHYLGTPSSPLVPPSDQAVKFIPQIAAVSHVSVLAICEFALVLITAFLFVVNCSCYRFDCLIRGQLPIHRVLFRTAIAPNAP